MADLTHIMGKMSVHIVRVVVVDVDEVVILREQVHTHVMA